MVGNTYFQPPPVNYFQPTFQPQYVQPAPRYTFPPLRFLGSVQWHEMPLYVPPVQWRDR